ncbi:O-fucosyltransferase family protein [Striga hermonthica]|uniref:O-fucosyltransferase family protein n=1 Tax=Striga hermonthica TaxID=68872 RepID=A0A9N7R8G3_STRHE|nr:O-fucosyltransferase family protein [Striga hermonthica]
MRWVYPAKIGGGGEGKAVVFRSRLKWVGLFGLVLSAFSLFTHFLLARYSDGYAVSEYKSSITIFSWRPTFEDADFSAGFSFVQTPLYTRLWAPVRDLESVHPYSNPRGNYVAPGSQSSGFVFVRIRGGFHEIRNSICDVVVVARLLNATLVIPEIQSTTSSKGISTEFKSFAYLYSEDQFISTLAEDIKIVKTLPKDLKGARRKKEIPSFKVPYSASPYFYLHHVLPVLNRHSVVELVVPDGGCLQAQFPPQLEEYQRLRCRVAFHALRFRQEVHELATKILYRLRASGRPFIAYDPGMTRDALAYHGCAELFQDVHTELIQHKRAWMIKRGIVKGNLSVDSAEQRLNGLCPLMPEEIGIILRAYGYSWDTIIYVSGGEVFGGQKKLIPLHAMFENVVDRTSLSVSWELTKMYGREANLVDKHPKSTPPPFVRKENKKSKQNAWKTIGLRPRPLPPPPSRAKYPYNIEGWWGWVAESDNEPASTVMELRTNAHKLLWEAIDYMVCVEADVFVPGFDRDGRGNPNFASMVTGHRMYRSAASKTFHIDRKEVARRLEENRDHIYQANHTWIKSLRKHLKKHLLDGPTGELEKSKPLSFLSFPIPECSCSKSSLSVPSPRAHPRKVLRLLNASSPLFNILRTMQRCPSWIDTGPTVSQAVEEDDVSEDELDPPETTAGLLFRQGGESNELQPEAGGGKEEEDQEELEGGER